MCSRKAAGTRQREQRRGCRWILVDAPTVQVHLSEVTWSVPIASSDRLPEEAHRCRNVLLDANPLADHTGEVVHRIAVTEDGADPIVQGRLFRVLRQDSTVAIEISEDVET